MISFKLFFEQYILREAFSLKQARKKGLSRKYSGAYNDSLNEVFDGKDRLIYPITIKHALKDSHPILKTIREFLYQKGFDNIGTEEYLSGIIKKDKQQFKIGRILQKAKDEIIYDFDSSNTIKGDKLLELYKTDPLRTSKTEDYYVVISRHPYDVAGSSTDRSWTSCIDLGTPRINYKGKAPNEGANRKYIQQDISEGTLVAYVVPLNELMPNGKITLRRPISRILMKPHDSDVGKIYTVGAMYGNKYPEFGDMMKEFVAKKLNTKLKGGEKTYFNPKLYNYASEDQPVGFEFKQGNKLSVEVLTELLDYNNDENDINKYISIETSNNGEEISYDITMTFNFGNQTVETLDELDRITARHVGGIESNFEKKIAANFFHNFKLTNLSPEVTMISLGNGIEAHIRFQIRIHSGEDEKYIEDEDYVWNTLYYSMESLERFNYQTLKSGLFKIVSEYDWGQDARDKQSTFDNALANYKEALDTVLPMYKSLDYISELKPFTIDDVLQLDDTRRKNLLNVLSRTQSAFSSLGHLQKNIPSNIQRSTDFIDKRHEIFYNWAKDKLGVDLVQYRDTMKANWSITDLFKYRADLDREVYETLLDVDNEWTKIERNIQAFIGDMGQGIKI